MEEIYINLDSISNARKISEVFEQDSRRYNRALLEEKEAKRG